MQLHLDPSVLGSTLRRYRQSRGEELSAIARRLEGFHKRDDLLRWLLPEKLSLNARIIGQRLRRLEAGKVELPCRFSEIRPVISAYEMPASLLASVTGQPVLQSACIQRLDDFFEFEADSSIALGQGCHCSVPPQRLAGSSVSISRLQLGPGGFTETHFQQGDELVLVRKGKAGATMHDSGLRILLDTDDYLHFWSEHPHALFNASSTEPADLLILRFDQRNRMGIRARLNAELRQLRSLLKGGRSSLRQKPIRETVTRLRRVDSWLEQLTQLRAEIPNEHNVTIDAAGLGALLRQFQRFNPDRILKESDSLEWRRNRNQLYDFRNGIRVAGTTMEDIKQIARFLNVDVELFSPFLVTRVPDYVVVAGAGLSAHENNSQRADWRELRLNDAQGGVRYEVPRRSLAGSDISISFLRFEPGAGTSMNHHPGHCVVLPVAGEVHVEMASKSGSFSLRTAHSEFAQYAGSIPHSLQNTCSIPAVALVIRYFDCAPMGSDEPQGQRRAKRPMEHVFL